MEEHEDFLLKTNWKSIAIMKLNQLDMDCEQKSFNCIWSIAPNGIIISVYDKKILEMDKIVIWKAATSAS